MLVLDLFFLIINDSSNIYHQVLKYDNDRVKTANRDSRANQRHQLHEGTNRPAIPNQHLQTSQKRQLNTEITKKQQVEDLKTYTPAPNTDKNANIRS